MDERVRTLSAAQARLDAYEHRLENLIHGLTIGGMPEKEQWSELSPYVARALSDDWNGGWVAPDDERIHRHNAIRASMGIAPLPVATPDTWIDRVARGEGCA